MNRLVDDEDNEFVNELEIERREFMAYQRRQFLRSEDDDDDDECYDGCRTYEDLLAYGRYVMLLNTM